MINARNRFLTAVLLVLIGVLLGGLLVFFQHGGVVNDQADVKFTEIKTSDTSPAGSESLEKMDARFLFKTVADKVTPTVVYISTVINLGGGEEESEFWNEFHERRARTVGSGVIVSPDGYIVTNNHVIEGAVEGGIGVIVNDKRAFEARIVGTDPMTDLAVLKIDASGLPSIVVGNSDRVEVGEWVLAIGNPFRLRSTVTAGIVSALSRQVQISGESNSALRVDSYIQTDAAINKGNSGGALVNTSGELIGINTAIATESGGYEGYGFAVPSNLVRKVMQDIIEFGKVRRALLGVRILGIDYTRAQELGMKTVRGVEVITLTEDGAAQKHDLRVHDVILAVNNEAVNEPNELQERIAVLHPGDRAQLTIWRNGKILEKDITLGRLVMPDPSYTVRNESEDEELPNRENEDQGIAFGTFSLGFKVMALATPRDHEAYDLIISEIMPSTEAARQGLQEGQIIREINNKPVNTLQELNDKLSGLAEGASVLIKVETEEGAVGYYQLKN